MTTPSALTREQVKEWMYRHQQASIARQKYRETSQTLDRQFAYDAELQELEEGIVAHYAAQRATIAQQAQEIERLTVELLAARAACEAWGNQVAKEREALAAMTTERDEWKKAAQQYNGTYEQLHRDLATAQARCKELDEQLRLCNIDQFNTQATLAAKEAKIAELEAEPYPATRRSGARMVMGNLPAKNS